MARVCQHCETVVNDDNRVMCPNCRRRIGDMPAPSTPEPEVPDYSYPLPTLTPTPPPLPAAPPPLSSYDDLPPYATPASYRPVAGLPPAVEVLFERGVTAGTSRVTVGFRLLLAIPHLIALYLLTLAAEVVTVLSWFAAVFSARVPQSLYGFVGWVLSYGARVVAYVTLLDDRWPSFGERPDERVEVRLPGPDRLNRAAVFFRVILLVPAMVVASIAGAGLAVIGFFVWVVTLLRGRVPAPAFDVTAAIIRYQTRYYAYAALLTARYPHGLLGDPDDPMSPPVESEVGRRLPPHVRSGTSRRLLVAALMLGIVGFIGQVALSAVFSTDSVRRQIADDQLRRAYNAVDVTDTNSCRTAADPLTCLHNAARDNADSLQTFHNRVDGIDFPSDTQSMVTQLEATTAALIDDLQQLSQAATVEDYQQIAAAEHVSETGHAFDAAVNQLHHELRTDN